MANRSTWGVSPDELSRDFLDGLEALQAAVEERVPPVDEDVRPVTRHRGNIVVQLGEWPTGKYERVGVEYVPSQVTVFVQIPPQFPTGGGKGFITSPPLERADRTGLNNNPWNDQLASAVEREVGDGEVKAYSHNWTNTSMNQPEDMAKFLDVAEEFLSRG
ncbi:hypothetical protein HSRCO_3028 (plasmid) [Halanaeroarchaeum sp. HSR-CO]|uniref:hypothetical protein n=1 Tax=Halanaeroarchaeum sp. HSR-CO TaxID=2866382 RepID=UPI00217D38B0|nr:hypothetical protein [Halanaeroarchaeum sp. HSR-CO]UWG49169.1 hypothetical protein HSRCO_3028 [Halanaeroarchaeum sp. HSR-CO]